MSQWQSGAPAIGVDPAMVGVRGWLKFLCISMVILSPVVGLISLLVSWPPESVLALYNVRVALWLVTVLEIAIQGFVVYAGIRLWSVERGAVSTAKIALVTCLGVAIVEPFMLNTIGQVPPEFASAVWQASLKEIVKMGVYVGIWVTYLSVSKRVAATYR